MTMALALHFLLIILLPLSCSSQDPLGNYCNNGNIITNPKTQSNVKNVLTTLLSKATATGFATASAGKNSTLIVGLAQCRTDVSSDDCKSCLAAAAQSIQTACPNQGDARIWYDFCFLRYDTKDFVGELDTGVGIFYWNVNNASEPERFEKELGSLMEKIRAQAVVSGSKGLGKGEVEFTPFVTIYALVQCTRDLSALNCAQCLATAEVNFQGYCLDKQGCRVLYSSCYVRYEIYPFFFPLENGSGVAAGKTSMRMVYP